MNDQPAVRNPAEDHYRHLATHPDTVPVLSLSPHIVAALRIDDLTLQIENDYRLVRTCTVPEPDDCWPDVEKLLRDRGEIVVPWRQARTPRYNLVLAASTRGIDHVRGSRLLVPHGGGFGQYRPWRPLSARSNCPPLTGLDRDQLMRDGQVRADAIILTHVREMRLLERSCPEALPYAVVAGCIAFDRLVASVRYRTYYKSALNSSDGRRTVVVTSTWSTRSAWGVDPTVFHKAVAAFPAEEYQVVAMVHPATWSHYGYPRVCGVLSDCLDAGMLLIAPGSDWRGPVAAADFVLSDYSSVGTFGAGIGTPVLKLPHASQPLLEGTPAAILSAQAPVWDPRQPLEPQLEAASHAQKQGLGEQIAEQLTSAPGEAARNLQEVMYRLLGLTAPDEVRRQKQHVSYPRLATWPCDRRPPEPIGGAHA